MQLVTSKWLNTCLTERIIWRKEKHKKVLIKKKKNTQPVKKNNTTVERRKHVQTLSTFIFILKFIRCIHLVPKWNITDLKKNTLILTLNLWSCHINQCCCTTQCLFSNRIFGGVIPQFYCWYWRHWCVRLCPCMNVCDTVKLRDNDF